MFDFLAKEHKFDLPKFISTLIHRKSLRIAIATKHSILVKSSKEDIQYILTEIAEDNQYSPIEDYLNSLPKPENTSILDNIAQRYFGVSEPIY